MSVHKIKSGGTIKWKVRWRTGGRDSPAHSQTFDLEDDALEFQLALRRTAQTGHRVRPASTNRKTVADAITAYTRGPGRATARTTQNQRADVLAKWVTDQLGEIPLALLDRPELENWRDDILADGCSPIQANRARSALSTILTSAASRGWIPANPILGWRALPEPKPDATPLNVSDVEHLRHALPTAADKCFLLVMAYAGLRTQEALALDWRNVHPTHLGIVRAYVAGEWKSTKTGTMRSVPIPEILAEDLRALRPGGASPHSHARGGVVFPSSTDPARPLDLKNWRRRVWKPALAQAGLPTTIRPYDARHTYASLALHSGVTPQELHHRMGHSSWTTTIRHYSHVIQAAGVAHGEPMDAAIRRARENVPRQLADAEKRRLAALDRLAAATTPPA